MKVSLKPGWEVKISAMKPKVYLLVNEACQLIDKTFDEIYCLGHLRFMSEHTPFNFSVFIV